MAKSLPEQIEDASYEYERVWGDEDSLKKLKRLIKRHKKSRGGIIPNWMEEKLKW